MKKFFLKIACIFFVVFMTTSAYARELLIYGTKATYVDVGRVLPFTQSTMDHGLGRLDDCQFVVHSNALRSLFGIAREYDIRLKGTVNEDGDYDIDGLKFHYTSNGYCITNITIKDRNRDVFGAPELVMLILLERKRSSNLFSAITSGGNIYIVLACIVIIATSAFIVIRNKKNKKTNKTNLKTTKNNKKGSKKTKSKKKKKGIK